jgi:hypothetical protein
MHPWPELRLVNQEGRLGRLLLIVLHRLWKRLRFWLGYRRILTRRWLGRWYRRWS